MSGFRWYHDEESLSKKEKYLNKMEVYVTDKFPTYDGIKPLDDDGGSVMLDLESGYVSRF